MNRSIPKLARTRAGTLVVLGLSLVAPTQTSAQSTLDRTGRGVVEVIAGGVDATSSRMMTDLATVLDDGSTRRVVTVIGKGSLQNLLDLKTLRGVDVAIVQTDVLDYSRAQRLVPGGEGAISYVAKLYSEEFHLLAGPEISSVADLAGKKVNFGPPGDGTAVTGPRLFEVLKIKVETTAYESALAFERLKSGGIAALAYVGGKPVASFAALRAQQGLHFVAIPLNAAIAAAYAPARLTAEDYPELVKAQEPVETIAVGTAMLVANLAPGSERARDVASFVDAFFTQFSKLQDPPHHPKWREVNLAADLPGWKRYPPADVWLKRNAAAPVAMNEQQLHDVFVRFLDERTRSTGQTMSAQQKDELFGQFRRWQQTQVR
jgi:uncharacterized protein